MKRSIRTGFSFGLTSGIITTMGLMVGLHSGTHDPRAVLGGILTIAIADAFSDALGIHISEESRAPHSHREIWESTISAFFSKFAFAVSFAVPILLLPFDLAMKVSVLWGFFALSALSVYMARRNNDSAWKVVGEHVIIAVIVLVLTHFTGEWIADHFGSPGE